MEILVVIFLLIDLFFGGDRFYRNALILSFIQLRENLPQVPYLV